MDFFPKALGDFVKWVTLQAPKRRDHAKTLGYSDDYLTQHDTADEDVLTKIAAADTAMSKARAAVAERDKTLEAYEAATRTEVARAKLHPAYTEAIGQDLQWISTTPALHRDSLKPTLRQRPSAEGIRLDWSKDGQDGVEVYRRPAGTAEWGRSLAFDSRSPYIDTEAGLHGTYEYCVQLMKDDKPVGERSDIVTVVVG